MYPYRGEERLGRLVCASIVCGERAVGLLLRERGAGDDDKVNACRFVAGRPFYGGGEEEAGARAWS